MTVAKALPTKGPVSKFIAGQKVQVLDPRSHQWRNAIINRPEPYAKARCDGAYVTYDPLPPMTDENGVMPSMGGWFSEKMIRDRAALRRARGEA